MSHTSRHKCVCNNSELIKLTAERLGVEFLGESRRYGAVGVGVKLRNWYHPCVFTNDEVLFDSDDSRRLEELNRFKQQYQVTAVQQAFPRARIIEQELSDGELELTVQLAGGYS